jgi:hypothetical protein
LFWATLLVHEAAHGAGAALAVGSMPFTREQFAALAPTQRLPAVAAGPIVTIFIVGSCAIVTRIVRSPTARLLFTATALTAASRLVLIMPVTLVTFGYNDETAIGAALAVSPRVLWSIEFLLTSICCYVVIRGLGPDRRSRTLWATGIASVIGWISAMTFGRWIGLPI